MDKNYQIIDMLTNNLDQLVVHGVRNMNLVVESVKLLTLLRENMGVIENELKEKMKDAVQDQAE